MPPVLFWVILVVVAAVLVYGVYAAAKRRKELERWARERGLRFRPSRDSGMGGRFGAFGCLRRGHNRYAYNVIEGQWLDSPVAAFDYHYTTGSGKNRTEHNFSAVIVESTVPLRQLRIRPEGIFDKLTEFLGFDDIDFESAEFSTKFHVSAQDRRWAYGVIDQRMMEYLLEAPRFSIELGRRRIIAWRERLLGAADFAAGIVLIRGILERLPEYIVREQTERE